MGKPRSKSFGIGQPTEPIDIQQFRCLKCSTLHGSQKCDLNASISVFLNTLEPIVADKVKEIAVRAVDKFQKSFLIANYITECCEMALGGHWQCFVTTDQSAGVVVKPACFINMKIGQVYVVLFKSLPEESCWKCGDALCKGDSCKFRMPEILQNDTNPKMTSEAINSALDALSTNQRPATVAQALGAKFEHEFGGKWQCIVSGTGASGVSLAAKPEHRISLRISCVSLTIFKAAVARVCWRCGSPLCGKDCINIDSLPAPKVLESNMSDAMLDAATTESADAIKMCDKPVEISNKLATEFEAQFGGRWQSSVSHCNNENDDLKQPDEEEFALKHNSLYFVIMKVAHVFVVLFKARQDAPPCWKCAEPLCDGTNCDLPPAKVIQSSMQKKMEREAISSSTDAVRISTNAAGVSEWVRAYFELKFKGIWQVAVLCNNTSQWSSSFKCKEHSFIELEVGSVKIVLFQAIQEEGSKPKHKFSGSLRF